ncbi:MAG TPA: hypothetical protein PKL31_16370 [Fulvivirga sp.]|nr:hypothetical protein [Fulvivirga sp.]
MRLYLFLVIISASGLVMAQNNSSYYKSIREFEPSEEYPFGRLNPNASPEVAQFSFMIGICDCIDSIRNQDGGWFSFPSIWQTKYFLNGTGIQDNYFNSQNPTSSLRLYDPISKSWKVTYAQLGRGYFVGTWEGGMVGDKMILTQEQTTSTGQKFISRLTFSGISNEGFDWISESVFADGKTTPGWIIHCKKRKQ